MRLQSLTIGLKSPYSPPNENNPYEAKLSVSYNENQMQVKLSHETCMKLLALCGEEVAQAAQVQISDFVRTALSVSAVPMIEGKAE